MIYYEFADKTIILNTIKRDNCRFKVKLAFIVVIVAPCLHVLQKDYYSHSRGAKQTGSTDLILDELLYVVSNIV